MKRERVQRSKWGTFMRLPVALRIGLAIAVVAPLLAILMYVLTFHGKNIVPDAGAWGQFGDFLGGTLGWLMSSIALLAIYATYIKEQEAVGHALEETFETRLTLHVQLLIQSILGWRAEHRHRGTITGHDVLEGLETQLWQAYVNNRNKGVNEIESWERAYKVTLMGFSANWNSLRGQIEQIARTILRSTEPGSTARKNAAEVLAPHVSSGIATFFAIAIKEHTNRQMREFVEHHGLLRAALPDRKDALLEGGIIGPSAFAEPSE